MPPATNENKYRKRRSPSGDANGAIASRTRHHKKRSSTTVKLDIPNPIIIEVISWLDQDSLMNFCLGSKQLHNIMCSEPGNDNKIIPVFAVTGNSVKKFVNNLYRYFSNTKTRDKLQNYSIMRFADPNRFNDEEISNEDFSRLKQILKDNSIIMNGITSLEFCSPSSPIFGRFESGYLPGILRLLLPNLRVINFSNTRGFTNGILKELF
jgi:hypothetical protein